MPVDLWNLLRHGFVPSFPVAICFVWRQKIVHGHGPCPYLKPRPKYAKFRALSHCSPFMES
ncbi:hypothetical protein BIFBRE_03230 [Bifidobacterium breve DSM 20213 = JCM 1192]|uniref:Uncharacterized protein n=1 Tax=Bifidobacterium breve DSM 20213 = JCM 1192 TaxID=518634 RepID=D4BMD6_BIFBR|nr:hypothetical protein BIFBRE_03230 [Bifidobacterium breve DSM 20213 = JCM 1192]